MAPVTTGSLTGEALFNDICDHAARGLLGDYLVSERDFQKIENYLKARVEQEAGERFIAFYTPYGVRYLISDPNVIYGFDFST